MKMCTAQSDNSSCISYHFRLHSLLEKHTTVLFVHWRESQKTFRKMSKGMQYLWNSVYILEFLAIFRWLLLSVSDTTSKSVNVFAQTRSLNRSIAIFNAICILQSFATVICLLVLSINHSYVPLQISLAMPNIATYLYTCACLLLVSMRIPRC